MSKTRPTKYECKGAGWIKVYTAPLTARDAVRRITASIKAHTPNVEAIAFTGVSGALLAPIVAYRLNLPLIVVRKHLECHSGHSVEGFVDAKTFVIVDDVISSGRTICRINEAILKVNPQAKLLGVFLGDPWRDDPWEPLSEVPIYCPAVYCPRRVGKALPSPSFGDTRHAPRSTVPARTL